MYKNQLQELAQRSCFNLPSYTCIREGPDHAPRFKAVVNFNGDLFESPNFCTTLRQAEHSAAEVALHSLSSRAPSHSLAARILDETGVYKNLLQEISQRVGARLPSYATSRSGLGHLPVFTCTVELAGITFTGEPAKNKKQAEKNAAMAAWSSLKKLAKQESSSSAETTESNDEQEQITIARALLRYRLKEKMAMGDGPDASSPFPKKFPLQPDRRPSSSSLQSSLTTGSKILPLIRPLSAKRSRPPPPSPTPPNDGERPSPSAPPAENRAAPPTRPHKFHASGAAPYLPLRHYRTPSPSYRHGIAPPVTIRTPVPVFSAPPLPGNRNQFQAVVGTPVRIAPPVQIRQAVPVFAAKPGRTPPPVTVQVKQPGSVVPVKEAVVVGAPSTEPVPAAGVTAPAAAEPTPPRPAVVVGAPPTEPVPAAGVTAPAPAAAKEPLPAPASGAEPLTHPGTSSDGRDFDLQHSLVIETLKELEL